VRYVLR